jgi:hypothetical protein
LLLIDSVSAALLIQRLSVFNGFLFQRNWANTPASGAVDSRTTILGVTIR